MDFGLYDPIRLVFFILVSHCWWTLTCTIPFVLSFSHWSVTVGGLWLVRSHSSCLFHTGQSLLVDFDLCAPTRLISLTLVNHCCWTLVRLCAPTHPSRLVFFRLVSHCWLTLTCTIPLVLSFLTLVKQLEENKTLLVDFDLCAPTGLVFLTLVSHFWWTLTCALPLVLSF